MVRHMGKNGSKRMSCHKKYKILRKVREHNRKTRRDTRKSNKLNKKKHKKTKPVSVPRICPFKDDLLGEAALVKQGLMEERERVVGERKSARAKQATDKAANADAGDTKQPVSVPVEVDSDSDTDREPTVEELSKARFDAALRACSRELKSVIAESDLVLEVLDARDPLGTRNREAERRVLDYGGSKRIVLVLNKVDLVPAPVARKWLAYLRQELPTVALKANAQAQLSKLSGPNKFKALPKKQAVSSGNGSDTQFEQRLATRQSIGAESLMQLVRNYARVKQTLSESSIAVPSESTSQPAASAGAPAKQSRSVTVGVIGYPNVGKRSVISCVRRERTTVAGVKPVVHVTRTLRAVQLDRNLRLLDSPGVVLDSAPLGNADATLRNALDGDFAHHATRIVDAVAAKIGMPKLAEHYHVCSTRPDAATPAVPAPHSASALLVAIAQRHGQLKKGGVPDSLAAAHRVVEDWQAGAIRYFALSPSRREKLDEKQVASIASIARDFDVETVYDVSDRNLFGTAKHENEMDSDCGTAHAGSKQQTVTS